MAKIELGNDFDAYLKKLESLEKGDTVSIMKMSLYDGTGVVADAIVNEIQSFPGGDNATNGPTDQDKADLLKGFGIAPMELKNDDVSVKIGFAGYGHKTRKYKSGVPIPMIARAIIAGTSFRPKNDFVGKVVRKTRNQCVTKMDETLNKELERKLK